MTYVVIACHFKSSKQLCKVTIARLEKVLSMAKKGDRIIVTGDVPYEPGGPTLGQLMKEWLVEKGGVPTDAVTLLKGAVGTFSEARVGCELLKYRRGIIVISSDWYLFYGAPIWRRRAFENNATIYPTSVSDDAGWRTILTYTVLGALVRVGILLGFEKFLENRANASQEGRRDGFTWDGCK